MFKKQQLFVYGRKELFILVFLSGMFSIFAFTLGIHLGKDVSSRIGMNVDNSTRGIASVGDRVPNEDELADSEKLSPEELDQLFTDELKKEVDSTGIHLSSLRQVELPTATKTSNGGATTLTTIKNKKR